MTLHADDEALMCRIFPSSLGPLAVKWYYKLESASIRNFHQLQKSFRVRFIINEVQPKQADSLWAMQIKPEDTLRTYWARYWECFNLVNDAYNDSMAITAFKMGLHPNSPLRSSLTRRPPKIVWALMKKVEEYCKVENDALRVKARCQTVEAATSGIVQPISVVPSKSPERRSQPKQDKRRDTRRSHDHCSHRANEHYQVDNRCTRHSGKKYTELAEPISKILPKVQHLPFFKWLPKMMGPFDARRQDKRCEYHKHHGHDTNSCYSLKDHLEELVQHGRLT
ncbi:uncharacterized protein LOC114293100 [Camellia sinensis]|uniref:uncharacterized protein LOC114293100 n=1 Tax=Camellia sinensis TaxID=4442 RepID=UPI001035F847|nr:uncharacterized protein LOC114293100 [Camellia sinensis]